MISKIYQRAKSFPKEFSKKNIEDYCNGLLAEFQRKFKISQLDTMGPDNLAASKNVVRESFAYWVEYKTKYFCGLRIGSDKPWRSVRSRPEVLKLILKDAVSQKRSLSEKVDLDWESLKGFGGDRHIAKKIIWCFDPTRYLPILSTRHLEYYARLIGVDRESAALKFFGRRYAELTLGQKYQLLQDQLLSWKDGCKFIKRWSSFYLACFLYAEFPPNKYKSARMIENLKKMMDGAMEFRGLGLEAPPNQRLDGGVARRVNKRNGAAYDIEAYVKRYRNNKSVGSAGERLVQKCEYERLRDLGIADYKRKVQVQKDGSPYDIKSVDKQGREIFIEVKTTKGSKETPFYMSAPEYDFSRKNVKRYAIYRLFEFDPKREKAKYFAVKGAALKKWQFKILDYVVAR